MSAAHRAIIKLYWHTYMMPSPPFTNEPGTHPMPRREEECATAPRRIIGVLVHHLSKLPTTPLRRTYSRCLARRS
jgi:hypothetical protein